MGCDADSRAAILWSFRVQWIRSAGTTVKRSRSRKAEAFIRPVGAEVPTDDAAILNDPTTVPVDLSRTPELGNRKTLTSHLRFPRNGVFTKFDAPNLLAW